MYGWFKSGWILRLCVWVCVCGWMCVCMRGCVCVCVCHICADLSWDLENSCHCNWEYLSFQSKTSKFPFPFLLIHTHTPTQTYTHTHTHKHNFHTQIQDLLNFEAILYQHNQFIIRIELYESYRFQAVMLNLRHGLDKSH